MTQRQIRRDTASIAREYEMDSAPPTDLTWHETSAQRRRRDPAAAVLIEQRVKRLKADPLKFELLRHLSLAPYASRKVADLAELLSVESADAEHAVDSLLGEGLVVSREDAAGTVFAISKSLSSQAFLRKLFGEVEDDPPPIRQG